MRKSEHPLISCLPKGSWLRDWVTLWRHEEPPRSYFVFSGLAMLGIMLGRRTHLQLTPELTVKPMVNIMLIGPAGIGKTIALQLGIDLLRTHPACPLIAENITAEKLFEDMSSDGKALLYADELAAVFTKQKYNESLVPFVTNLLSYKPAVSQGRKSTDTKELVDYEFAVVGGSTQEWLQKQIPDAAAAGGFLPRFLIVEENEKYQDAGFQLAGMSARKRAEWDEEKTDVVAAFHNLVADHGAMTLGWDAIDAIESWLKSHKAVGGLLAPFTSRRKEYVLRLAMLVALSCQRKVIRGEDVTAATKLYVYCESRLANVVIPCTIVGEHLMKLLQCIPKDGTTDVSLRRQMRSSMLSSQVDALIRSLTESGDIVRGTDKKLRKVVA